MTRAFILHGDAAGPRGARAIRVASSGGAAALVLTPTVSTAAAVRGGMPSPLLHIPRPLRTPRRRPARHLARIRDVHARERADQRVIEILLRVLDQDLHAELRQAIVEEEGADGGYEVVVLHPRELGDGEQVRF